MLVRAIPYWKIDWSMFQGFAPAFLGTIAFMMLAIVRGKTWIRPVILVLLAGWCIFSFAWALYEESALQALFGLLLSLLTLSYLEYVKQVFESPYLSPGIKWYQSLPEALPGIHCNLGRVAKISEEGVFILGRFERLTQKNLPTQATLEFKGRKLACAVQPISAIQNKNPRSSYDGIGLQFKGNTKDFTKDIADFVERLRGEGHV